MSIVDRKKNEILKEERLNKSFLSAKLNELNIECKIFKDDFYCDSFNYFPISKKLETFNELFSWQTDNPIDHFYSEPFLEYLKKNIEKFKIIKNSFILGSSPGDNYYTNLIYFLPRIFFNDQDEIKLCIHRNLSNKFRKFILKICNNLNKKLSFVYLDDDFYFFKDCLIPQFISLENSNKILNHFVNTSGKNQKKLKIYISRQNTDYRNVVNEDDLIKLLKSKGFRIIDPNQFNISEQISFFSNAEVVISPTGSNLANIIFCKPGTKIVEIAPVFREKYEFNLSKRYEILSKINGLEHSIVNADTVKTKKHSVLAKKYINKKVLEESSYYSDLIVRINNFNNF